MPKLIDIVKTAGQDALGYFTKNKGVNSTTGVTLVGAPGIIQMMESLSSGTDMSAAFAAGGWSAYVAIAWYVLRFAVYIGNKTSK